MHLILSQERLLFITNLSFVSVVTYLILHLFISKGKYLPSLCIFKQEGPRKHTRLNDVQNAWNHKDSSVNLFMSIDESNVACDE